MGKQGLKQCINYLHVQIKGFPLSNEDLVWYQEVIIRDILTGPEIGVDSLATNLYAYSSESPDEMSTLRSFVHISLSLNETISFVTVT